MPDIVLIPEAVNIAKKSWNFADFTHHVSRIHVRRFWGGRSRLIFIFIVASSVSDVNISNYSIGESGERGPQLVVFDLKLRRKGSGFFDDWWSTCGLIVLALILRWAGNNLIKSTLAIATSL